MKRWTKTQLENAKKFDLDTSSPYIEAMNSAIKKMVEEKKGTLLEGGYEKNLTPFKIRCHNGHEFETYWNRFSRGIWCRDCGGTAPLSIEQAQKEAEKRSGKLLSTRYINAKTKLTWQCSEGHEFETSLEKVRLRNQWCPTCNGKQKPDWSEIQNFVLYKGGRILSLEYVNSQADMRWQCKEKHEWTACWSTIKRGHWCPYCAGLAKTSIHVIRDYINSKNGELISTEYKGNKAKLNISCNDCNLQWEARWNNIYNQQQWCPNCNWNGTSKVEQELVDWIKSLIPDHDVQSNARDIIPPYEVDAHIPHKKLAIEFHGLYWHSARNPRKHFRIVNQKKYIQCQKLGIQLVQIFEDEWRLKPDIVKSIITSRLGKSESTVYARNCEIKEISVSEANAFFKENHLSGSARSEKAFGLFFEQKLVSAIAVRKPFTESKKGNLEISRFASKLNTNIPGGFQKLLVKIKQYAQELNMTGILSYSDCRIGPGKVYLNAGFEHIGRTPPNYFYEKGGVREHRFKHRKNNDPEFIAKYGSTEREQNHSQGWFEIYDAGSEIYILKL